MIKSNIKLLQIIELLILIISITLIFFSKKEHIPTLFTLIFLVLVSFYFSPVKLLFLDTNKYLKLSAFILALCVGVGALQLFKTVDVLVLIFGIVNFVFMVFIALATNEKTLGNRNYKFLIASHFLAFFLLQ